MLDFSFYDLCVGIDSKMLFRWVMFFRVIVERTNFVRLRKLVLAICTKTFAPTPLISAY